MMTIKILSVLTFLSLFAASNVIADDFKRNNNFDYKRQNPHVVAKNKQTTKRVITTHYYGNNYSNKVISKEVVSKKVNAKKVNSNHVHSKKLVSKKSNQHKHANNRNDRLGLLVGGIVIGSILFER